MRKASLRVVLSCAMLGVVVGLLAAASRAQSASLQPLTVRGGERARALRLRRAEGLEIAHPLRWAYAYYATSEAVRLAARESFYVVNLLACF